MFKPPEFDPNDLATKIQPFHSRLRAGDVRLPRYKPLQKTEVFCAPSEGSEDPPPGANPTWRWQDRAVQLQSTQPGSPAPNAEGAHEGRTGVNQPQTFLPVLGRSRSGRSAGTRARATAGRCQTKRRKGDSTAPRTQFPLGAPAAPPPSGPALRNGLSSSGREKPATPLEA